MNTLPYDDILQLVAECTADLDKSEATANGMLNRLFAPIEQREAAQRMRTESSQGYTGAHRRADEQIKGQVSTIMPKVVYHGTDH